MDTIVIKNLSTVQDRAAVSLIANYWTGGTDDSELDLLGIRIIKKGHTFTIIERSGESKNERIHID
jgi:hypothetical protein